jgi:predicted transcriptional regulator YheO
VTTREPPARDLGRRIEEDVVVATLAEIVPALGAFMGSSCEVVAHDLRVPERSIVGIVNGHVTGRSLGGPLIGGPRGDLGMQWIKSLEADQTRMSYETMTQDGRRLHSTTTLFRNRDGRPIAALCVNLDIEAVAPVASWLASLVEVGSNGPRAPAAPPPQDVDQVLRSTIDESFALLRYRAGRRSSKQSRLAIVKELDKRGVFLVRGAVSEVARRLDVSKFTVYRYLDEARGEA